MTISFIDDFKQLPAKGPANHAHIINVEAITPTDHDDYMRGYKL